MHQKMWQKNWAIALIAIAGSTIALPSYAGPPNQSDITGGYINGNPANNFGFGTLPNASICNSTQSLQSQIAKLLNRNSMSSNTRKSLSTLSDNLGEFCAGQLTFNKPLDQSIRNSAQNLLQDFVAAKSACRAGSCSQLNSLVEDTQPFLNLLEDLRQALVKKGQVSRIF